MSRNSLALGASILTLALACASYAEAQQSLPTINVGGARQSNKPVARGNGGAGRTTGRPAAVASVSGTATGVGTGVGAGGDGNGQGGTDRYAEPKPKPFSRGVPANIPAVVESRTRAEIENTVNMVTTAEAFKYLPSLYIRERYIGDQNAIIAGRVNGPTESAQTMLYADGVLLSNYLGNSFAYPPRWNMVSPEEIERIDVIYGPFSSLYQGNSVGGVLNIKTRMPEGRELHFRGVGSAQTFSYLGYSDVPLTGNVNILYGDKLGDNFRFFLAYNHLDASGQPMQYSGGAIVPPGVAGNTPREQFYGGAFKYDQNGMPALYTGAYGINRTNQDLGKVKMSYDVAPLTRLTYQAGFWSNVQNTSTWTSIYDRRGVPIYNNTIGIYNQGLSTVTSTGNVPGHQGQQHLMQSLQLKRDTGKIFDFELTYSSYNYLRDFNNQANNWGPIGANVSNGLPRNYTQNQTGRNTQLDGTYWNVGDLRFIYRPEIDLVGKHEVSFGSTFNKYSLNQAQQLTAWWPSSVPVGFTAYNVGQTSLRGGYVQDAWQIHERIKFIGGLRGDWWNAFGGENVGAAWSQATNQNSIFPSVTRSAAIPVVFPNSAKGGFQPKAAIEFKVAEGYEVRGSMGRAYRFPTVTELFQSIQGPNSTFSNNPNLQPQVSTSWDFTQSWRRVDPLGNNMIGLVNPRISLFYEDRWNAIIQQQSFTGISVTQNLNVNKARFRGIEAALIMKDFLIDGLGYSGSITFTDAKILNNNTVFAGNAVIPLWTLPTATTWGPAQLNGGLLNGNNYVGIPPIKMRSVFTYTPTKDIELALASTYNSAAWQTVQNVDVNHNTLYSISELIQFDAKANWRFEKNWRASIGIENIGNYKAFVFHPLQQRTFFAGLYYDFGGPQDSLESGSQNQTGAWQN